jgi:mannose-6-phosphate isomerase-like protein (cupin superfamily)
MPSSRWTTEEGVPTVDEFQVRDLAAQLDASGELWMEFLRVPAMSAGIYKLRAGQEDPQSPHHEDEVYYVVSGRAVLRVADQELAAVPGAVLFVEAEAEHRFEQISEDLTLLVIFAPAETASEGG